MDARHDRGREHHERYAAESKYLELHGDTRPGAQNQNRQKTRVVIADDHRNIRVGIRRLLEASGDIEVAGEAVDGVQALELVEKLSPDVLLLDMEMPRLSGSEVAKHLHTKQANVRILVVSAYDESQYVLSLFRYGVAGYLTKDDVPGALVKAVRRVANHHHSEQPVQNGWVSRRVAEKLGPAAKNFSLIQ